MITLSSLTKTLLNVDFFNFSFFYLFSYLFSNIVDTCTIECVLKDYCLYIPSPGCVCVSNKGCRALGPS